MQALYTATATAVGGRSGTIKSSDGVLDLRLAYPKELGGPGGAATNPEQLFAAGYAACFENAPEGCERAQGAHSRIQRHSSRGHWPRRKGIFRISGRARSFRTGPRKGGNRRDGQGRP